jgi:hypothetical protein
MFEAEHSNRSAAVTHHETTAQTMPTIRLVSEGLERDLLQQPQQPPTAVEVTWAASRKMA